MGAAAVGVQADRDIRRRGWRREEIPRLVEPTLLAIELDGGTDLGVDPVVGLRVTQRPSPEQAHEDDLVPQGMGGQRDRGPRDGQIAALAAEVGAPGARVVTAGFGERSDDAGQWTATACGLGGLVVHLVSVTALRHRHGLLT